MAEFLCLIDADGQTRDILVTEALPNRNLSASAVNEIRRLKWVPADGPNGPVADRMPFRLKYEIGNQARRLSAVAGTLRAKAKSGDADAQYLLSRLLFSVEGIRKD